MPYKPRSKQPTGMRVLCHAWHTQVIWPTPRDIDYTGNSLNATPYTTTVDKQHDYILQVT